MAEFNFPSLFVISQHLFHKNRIFLDVIIDDNLIFFIAYTFASVLFRRSVMKEADFLLHLGKRIKSLRLEKGLTQQRVASDCDFEKSNLSRIESGKTNPTALSLFKIARSLNICVSEFLTDTKQ